MVSTIKLKNGEEWFLKYVSVRDDYDIIPFCYEIYDKPIYMNDGTYELDNGKNITIKDKKIIEYT